MTDLIKSGQLNTAFQQKLKTGGPWGNLIAEARNSPVRTKAPDSQPQSAAVPTAAQTVGDVGTYGLNATSKKKNGRISTLLTDLTSLSETLGG